MPALYSAEARALWDATLAGLPPGLVKASDQAALERFAPAWTNAETMRPALMAGRLLVPGERGNTPNGAIVQCNIT